jgi:hypothetical protein
MSQRLAIGSLFMALSTMPAFAQGDNPARLVWIYLSYAILCGCLLGWSFLVLLIARSKVEGAAHTLGQRPLASFVMGMLCCGWLLLSLSIQAAIGPLGGLLVAMTLCLLMLCALLGLPAILMGLGRRASVALGLGPSVIRDVTLGAAVLFAAGGLPFLGWLMLAGVTLWACGGAVLSLLAGSAKDRMAPGDQDDPA